MPLKKHAIAFGTSPKQAEALIGGAASSLVATGTTQGGALPLSSYANEFITVATGSGAILPVADPGDSIFVYNGGAVALLVYGQTGENIANGSANAGFSVAANKGCLLTKVSNTRWGQNLSA